MTHPAADNDATLIARTATGNRSAFATIVRRHHARVHALAWRITNDRGHAEDAAQDALLTLWRQAGRYDAARGSLSAWLTRITIHAALDGRRRLRPTRPLDPDWPAPPPSDAAHDVTALLATLSPRARAAMALCYLEGYSVAETATLLSASVKAVESMLSRARAQLRAAVSDDD